MFNDNRFLRTSLEEHVQMNKFRQIGLGDKFERTGLGGQAQQNRFLYQVLKNRFRKIGLEECLQRTSLEEQVLKERFRTGLGKLFWKNGFKWTSLLAQVQERKLRGTGLG